MSKKNQTPLEKKKSDHWCSQTCLFALMKYTELPCMQILSHPCYSIMFVYVTTCIFTTINFFFFSIFPLTTAAFFFYHASCFAKCFLIQSKAQTMLPSMFIGVWGRFRLRAWRGLREPILQLQSSEGRWPKGRLGELPEGKTDGLVPNSCGPFY